MKSHLASSFRLDTLNLRNRVVMAPLTRDRAGEGNVPTPLMATYYAQRASFGLIITEATPVSPSGHGYPATPGIYTAAQIAGWKEVTRRVHAEAGLIFNQLWHVGRISHESYQPGGQAPVSASAVAAQGAQIWKPDWSPVEAPVLPRAMSLDEIARTVADFRQATLNAKEAGFDGVEIHGANGYLINQFLCDGSNRRQDEYGGSVENRCRFLFEILDACCAVWPGRVALRLSPSGEFNDMADSDRHGLFAHIVQRLNSYALAYLHIVEPRMMAENAPELYTDPLSTREWRPLYHGTLISSGSHNAESAERLVASGQAQLIAFGRLAISNPDLPRRLIAGAPLNPYDRDSFYGGGEKGYVDYPFLS
ncbi:MAG: hypothetical protein RL095_2320 [Verrucomicrobiota bacterium]|jgi:N-ethylmaleimide reductase